MSANNFLKLNLAQSQNKTATNRALDATKALGRNLPCVVEKIVSSGIVTVRFQVQGFATLPDVTMPVDWSEYTRIPVPVGCKGVARAADLRLGGLSGLGSGTPTLNETTANLQGLVFCPIGSTSWTAVDASTLVLYGEPNVLIQDKSGVSKGLFTSTGITLSSQGHTLTITSAGVAIDGVLFATHVHTDVQSGSDDTGPVA